MALTRSFRDMVKARLAREPAFRQALLSEAENTLIKGDLETGKDVLRDFQNGRAVGRGEGGGPSPTVTKEDAAREAVQQLGLLTPDSVPTIARLLQDEMRDHPRAIATAYLKEGEQVSDQEKKALGLRKNCFLSRAAFAEITTAGRIAPLTAHETTLLRATFTLNRDRCVSQERELQGQLGERFVGFEPETLHRECPACNRLDGLLTSGRDAAIMPPADCVPGCIANYGIRPKIDWLAGIE